MLHTREDTKRAILEYLVRVAKDKGVVEDYTISKLADVVQADSTQIENAIQELKEDDLIESCKVQLAIYTPRNEDGFKTRAFFAKRGYLYYSPYWAFIVGGLPILAYFTIWYSIHPSLYYKSSYIPSLILSPLALGGLVGALIQYFMTRFRKWQLVSGESYRLVSVLVKNTAYIFLPLLLAYSLACITLGYRFELTGALTALAISVAVSFGYQRLAEKKI